MFNFITSLVLASLLIPNGFNFLIQRATNYYQPETTEIVGPRRIINNSLGIVTTAQSILVIDDQSQKVLVTKNRQAASPIASITKLATVLVFLKNNPGWDKEITITDQDRRNGGFIYLLPGEKVRVKDLFYLTLVASSNEAAAALSRSTGLENFISEMNQLAAELGMSDTYFSDPAGLDPTNVSSAVDLIKLARAAFADENISAALTTDEYEFKVLNNGRQGKATNTNKLLASFLNNDNYQVLGAKTGYLEEAGYCLLLKVKKAAGPALILVLLGVDNQDNRWQEAKGMVDWVFRNYEWTE